MKYFFLYSVFFITLCLFFPYGAQALSVGQDAPSFTLQLFEGGTLSLSELRVNLLSLTSGLRGDHSADGRLPSWQRLLQNITGRN